MGGGQPADDNHRFGHGKAEALSALFQVVLIGVSAMAWRCMRCSNSSGERTGGGRRHHRFGVAIVGTLALLAWQRTVIRAPAPSPLRPTICTISPTSSSIWR
jgi:ferrous-iron efflux pump FieF